MSELEECRAAAFQLGRLWGGSHNKRDRPAGCYYFSSHNYVFHNSARPSDTQNILSTAGGLCKRGMSDFSVHIVHTRGKLHGKKLHTLICVKY